jgi:hypothetical protein
MTKLITCTPKSLPRALWQRAARTAVAINQANHSAIERLASVVDAKLVHDFIAASVNRYWHSGGVILSVEFLDDPAHDLRARILSHMNAWAPRANVRFTETDSAGEVRIAMRGGQDGGYWSYVGTDILSIPADEPTMNLEAFSMQTPESEFHRVVRHETGHTMGFVHEHMRRELVELIDVPKAIEFFGETQGWIPDMVRAQVLTPIEERSLLGSEHADGHSIMCYQLPGAITVTGEPIPGGTDIDAQDFALAAKLYPPRSMRPGNGARPAVHGASAGTLWFAPGTDPDTIARVVATIERR